MLGPKIYEKYLDSPYIEAMGAIDGLVFNHLYNDDLTGMNGGDLY